MHDEIETAELLVHGGKHALDLRVRGNIARQDQRRRCQSLRQFLHVIFEASLIGQCQPRAASSGRLRDRPRKGALVCDTDDESLLTSEVGHE